MGNLLYPMIAVALSLLGGLVLWLRSRKPRTMESGIEEFSKELRALAPEPRRDHHAGKRSAGG